MIYAVEKLSKQYDYLYDLCFPMGDYINTGKPVKQTLAQMNTYLIELESDLNCLCYGKWKKKENNGSNDFN